MSKQTLETAIHNFTRNMIRKDDTPLMLKAHEAFDGFEIDPDDLRSKLESAAGQVVVTGKDGTERPATWPKAKLDMIVAGACRSDAGTIQSRAVDLASREGVRANAYHIAAYMAATALDMPGADVDTLAQSAEKKYPSGTALEDKRRKAKSAGKTMKKAMVAFMKEAEAHASADELADAQEELDGMMAAFQKITNIATADE